MSLLNDDAILCTQSPRSIGGDKRVHGSADVFSSSKHHLHLRHLSPAPDLTRSDSWSSQRASDSPSPETPGFHNVVLTHSFHPGSHGHILRKDVLQKSTTSPRPHTLCLSSPRSTDEPSPPLTASPATTPTSLKPTTKNFPCQLAEEYGCDETFTTSGHASRHAKKHTGEKKVACPKCPKRFARKDNMKQHLKTHDTGGRASTMADTTADAPSRLSKAPRARSSRLGKRAGSPLPRASVSPAQAQSPGQRARLHDRGPEQYDSYFSHSPPHGADGHRHGPADGRYASTAITPGLNALALVADATMRQ